MLTIVISFGFVIKSSLIIKYQLDKSEFVKYCINLNKPEKKCEGKCHLNAQLKETDKSASQDNVPASISNFEISFFTIQYPFLFNFDLTEFSISKSNASYLFKLSTGYINSPFHPPIF